MKRDQEYVGRNIMEIELPGKRKRGKPKRRFLNVVKEDVGKLVQGKTLKQDFVEEHHMLWQPLIKGKGQKKKKPSQ